MSLNYNRSERDIILNGSGARKRKYSLGSPIDKCNSTAVIAAKHSMSPVTGKR